MKKRAPKVTQKVLDELEVPERFREVASVPVITRGRTHAETLDNLGIEEICLMIKGGKGIWQIAQDIDVPEARVYDWLGKNPEYSARALQARVQTAQLWDEMAERTIQNADGDLSFQKARELAHHYRWRAGKIAPKQYGDRVEKEITGGMTLDIRTLSPEERAIRMQSLAKKALTLIADDDA